MDRYRVRRQGSEVWAGTLDELRVLHADGKIRPGDEVWDGARWVPGAEVPSMRPRRSADPFAAWDDADGVDAASVVNRVVRRPEAEALAAPPIAAPSRSRSLPPPVEVEVPPMEDERTDPGKGAIPEVRPAAPALRSVPGPSRGPAVAAEPPEPVEPPPPRPPRQRPPDPGPDGGVIIDFPAFKPPPSAVWQPERPAPPPPVPAIRPGRVALYVGIGLVVLGAWAGWVRLNADGRFGIEEAAPPVARRVEPAPTPTPSGAGALAEVEAALRAGAGGPLRPVAKPGDLSDALLIDLTNLKVDFETVEAEVTEWSGRYLDQPRRGRVRVTLHTAEELDRSLGAVALVVGRYAQAYRIELEPIEVRVRTSAGDRRTLIDPTRAMRFYGQELTLEQLLRPS